MKQGRWIISQLRDFYESLLDLEAELPAFRLVNLFTPGSPLWLVQPLLDDRSGRRARNVERWANIHTQAT